MMTQLQQKLAKNEEELAKIKIFFLHHKEEKTSPISTTETSSMTETSMVISSSIDISRDHLGEVENNTRGIG
jgi:hypothetical protein